MRPTIHKGTNRATLKLYWQQMRRHKLSLIVGSLLIPISALLLNIGLPYYLSLAIGQVTSDHSSINNTLIIAGLVGATGALANLIGYLSMTFHDATASKELRDATVERLLQKDSDFFANQKIGALTGRLIDFTNSLTEMIGLVVVQTISFILSLGVGLAIIFSTSISLGFIILGLIVFVALQARLFLYLRRYRRHARKELIAEVNGTSADTIGNNLTVKTFAQEHYEERIIGTIGERYRQAHIKDFRIASIDIYLRFTLMAGVQIIAVYIVAQLVMAGSMELGVAIFTVAYLQRISTNLFSMGEIINSFDQLFLRAAPITEILLSSNNVLDRPGAKKLIVKRGRIDFKNVAYSYTDNTNEMVIKDLSLHIPEGQRIGLVGHSGAGKTTFTRLLLRFADTNKGSLEIDGQNIAHVTQSSLRKAIAYVPQEPLLFHRSLRDNIAYARPRASTKDIEEAARKANALEFIQALPNGLDTVVGERGVKLSGGQRQRIALARAILKDAPILVLDEATSALDSVSEKLIQEALGELMKGRTSIVIAHRLSTIATLDRIIVLDKGKIAEDGTHRELLAKGGIYATLWKHQSGGFIE